MKTKNIEDIYELSPLQQGMLFHCLYAPEAEMYVAQRSYMLNGQLNIDAFQYGWQQVINRHTALRTSFHWEKSFDKPLQVVHRHLQQPVDYHDGRHLSPIEQQKLIEACWTKGRKACLEPGQAPLMQLCLIQLADESYEFIWTHHMMLLDGWSVPIIVKEVFSFYEGYSQNLQSSPGLSYPYGNYISWLQQQDLDKAKAFWQHILKGFKNGTVLGIDKAPGQLPDKNDAYDQETIKFNRSLTQKLQSFANEHQLTVNTLVQGAWSLLLSRYSGENDIVYGTTSSGRPATLPGVESMVGLFINTLPVRVQIPAHASLLPWLIQLQKQQIKLREYEYTPLAQIQQWANLSPGKPLFETIVVFENYPVDETTRKHEETLDIKEINAIEKTNYAITLLAGLGHELTLKIIYNCSRFEDQTIHCILSQLKILLQAMVANPNSHPAILPLLTEPEKHRHIVEWNATQTDYRLDKSLHQLIENQVNQSPQAIATIFEDKALTYHSLNQRANQLANYLIQHGVGPEVRVGVYMDRSHELMIGLLAILKAGGAYVPLDLNYPQSRLAYMLHDSRASIILTHKDFTIDFADSSITTINLDKEWDKIAASSSKNPTNQLSPNNTAYVIYTSGSTGRPKGVMNTHFGICNRLLWMQETFQLTEKDRVLQKTPFSFDVSVWEFFWPLLTGASLVFAQPGGHKDSSYLVNTIIEQKITTIHFVPSMLQMFVDEPGIGKCHSLRQVICSGEALSFDLQQRFFASGLDANLFNLYGPTEAAIDVTFWQCSRESDRSVVPIGKPIANTEMYILDQHSQLLPAGVPGELHIAGFGLARGYLNRPKLTAEKFVPHPFADQPGARMYKTGDLARFLSDGSIEFLGRLDYQVKIRGNRIELGEIEAVLAQHPAVKEAVILAQENAQTSDKQLIAYIVPAQLPAPATPVLRSFLRKKLPDYMVPAIFIMLSQMPLTVNGKINRRALSLPERTGPELNGRYIAPRDEQETRLAKIWSEVLNIEKIGIDDNFFDLGGDSFKAIRVMRELQYKGAKVADLFDHPTIKRLAEYIRSEPDQSDNYLLHEMTPPSKEKTVTLVCIPYGGGDAFTYKPLADALPPAYALYALALPGHNLLAQDEPLMQLKEVAQQCVQEIKQTIKGPVALYGHCIGVALTIEIARLLETSGTEISMIFQGASFPFPEKKYFGLRLSKILPLSFLESDKKLHAYLKSLGGFEEVIDPGDLKFLMHSFRHDGQEAVDYFTQAIDNKHFPLKTPTIFIAGDQDPETENFQERYQEWATFSQQVSLKVVNGGGHYFLKHQAAELAQIIVDSMPVGRQSEAHART